jgi:hypothetical protein
MASSSLVPKLTTSLEWTPQQHAYRCLLRGLRDAYYHDRSKLFWARHRARIEFYKYASIEDEVQIKQLVGITNEISQFIAEHMKTNVDRIIQHNEKMMSLRVSDAKRFREEYLLREKQHDSWCKQKIKHMMSRRPDPPYPYI